MSTIKIENTEVMGWQGALRGMRNPKNSWNKADTTYDLCVRKDGGILEIVPTIGPNDMKLATALVSGGPVHRKFLRMVHVQCDITAPAYWVPEFDTYKVATVRDSCSIMHKGASRDFTDNDFLFEDMELPDFVKNSISNNIESVNWARQKFVETNDFCYFRLLRQLLPHGYNIKFTWDANYEVLLGIYHWRYNHRLVEWHEFCDWIKGLPYMKEFIEAASGRN